MPVNIRSPPWGLETTERLPLGLVRRDQGTERWVYQVDEHQRPDVRL
jgi:hypothetical protein